MQGDGLMDGWMGRCMDWIYEWMVKVDWMDGLDRLMERSRFSGE